jgi:hypothetical protein
MVPSVGGGFKAFITYSMHYPLSLPISTSVPPTADVRISEATVFTGNKHPGFHRVCTIHSLCSVEIQNGQDM